MINSLKIDILMIIVYTYSIIVKHEIEIITDSIKVFFLIKIEISQKENT
jgi:hypothetical protein